MDSCKKVLDREQAVSVAQPINSLASLLLCEIINKATWILKSCQNDATSQNRKADYPPCLLYKHAIEMADGIEVLLSHSCGIASKPLVRTLLETTLSLKYMLDDDMERRALAWLCCFIHDHLDHLDRSDPTTTKGEALQETWNKFFGIPYGSQPQPAPDAYRSYAQGLLRQPDLAPIEEEYQRTCQRKKRPWYALFGGPRSLYSLEDKLDRLVEYDVLYRLLSRISHATDLSAYVTRTEEGSLSFLPGRQRKEIEIPALAAAYYLLSATKLIVHRILPQQEKDLDNWYKSSVSKPLRELLVIPS